MLIYFLAAVTAILLFLLYHYMPNRKLFWAFFALLIVAGVSIWHFYPREEPQPVISAEEREDITQQQKIFSDWYAGYQKDLTDLDHNWQQYHRILDDFQHDVISIETVYLRLSQLEQNQQQLVTRISKRNPPVTLHDNIYDQLIEVMKKTNAYADAEYRTIALTKAAADPEKIRSESQEEQSQMLTAVMNRESPSALFIADEIASIRDILTLPDEDENKSAEDP